MVPGRSGITGLDPARSTCDLSETAREAHIRRQMHILFSGRQERTLPDGTISRKIPFKTIAAEINALGVGARSREVTELACRIRYCRGVTRRPSPTKRHSAPRDRTSSPEGPASPRGVSSHDGQAELYSFDIVRPRLVSGRCGRYDRYDLKMDKPPCTQNATLDRGCNQAVCSTLPMEIKPDTVRTISSRCSISSLLNHK